MMVFFERAGYPAYVNKREKSERDAQFRVQKLITHYIICNY